MSKSIPSALQTSRDTYQTTECFLIKFMPQVAADFGVTSLDIDVDYDDGDGEITYSSSIGLNPTSFESGARMAVDNSEAMLLIGSPFTKVAINAGALDYADFVVYKVDYNDLTAGRHEIIQSGRTGIVRSNDDLAGVIELRSLQQQTKQNYNDQYSVSCRAIFGSQVGEEKFPCNFDAISLFQANTVLSVSSEPDRIFTATITPAATGPNGALPMDISIIEFLTGNNAGLVVETEDVTGDVITLRFQSDYDIEATDTFRMRPDCQKRYNEDCIALYDNHLNFRGEPLLPLTEESPSQYPGANVKALGAPLITS